MGGPQLKLAGGMWGRGLVHDGKCVAHIAAAAECVDTGDCAASRLSD